MKKKRTPSFTLEPDVRCEIKLDSEKIISVFGNTRVEITKDFIQVECKSHQD